MNRSPDSPVAWILIPALIALPVIEIALFIQSARWIGLGPTILLALAAGMEGIALVRSQGLATMGRLQADLRQGTLPVTALFDGLCLAMAGMLLILPGFMTDIAAIALLLPPVRAGLRLWLARRLKPARPDGTSGPVVIDADYTVVDEPPGRRLP